METKTLENSTDPYYIDPSIKNQLDKGQAAIKNAGQDRIYLVTGREGAGKSLLAMQLGYYIDNNLSLDDITMTPDEFFNKVRLTKHKVVIGDEIFAGLSSKGALTKENKKLVRLLIECRQRGLTIFLCIPSIFLLEKYIAIFRSHGLFNVQISRKDYNNRFYKVYNYANKKTLFILGQRYMSYAKPKIWKMHRFYGKTPPTIDKQSYETKKAKAFTENKRKEDEEEENRYRKWMIQRDVLVNYLRKEYKVKFTTLSRLFEKYKVPVTAGHLSEGAGNIEKLGLG